MGPQLQHQTPQTQIYPTQEKHTERKYAFGLIDSQCVQSKKNTHSKIWPILIYYQIPTNLIDVLQKLKKIFTEKRTLKKVSKSLQ